TREIGLAVLATTMALIAVFLPVAFMGGIVGRFMQSFGFTMSFAIGVSLLVSFTLTPMLASRWLKGKDARTGGEDRTSLPSPEEEREELEKEWVDPPPETDGEPVNAGMGTRFVAFLKYYFTARPRERAEYAQWRRGERNVAAAFGGGHGRGGV